MTFSASVSFPFSEVAFVMSPSGARAGPHSPAPAGYSSRHTVCEKSGEFFCGGPGTLTPGVAKGRGTSGELRRD